MMERNCFLLLWLPHRAYGREEWEQGGSSRLRSESAAGAGNGREWVVQRQANPHSPPSCTSVVLRSASHLMKALACCQFTVCSNKGGFQR